MTTLSTTSSVDVQCPAGFRAAAATCGIKPSGAPDLALIVADNPNGVPAAAMFTRNRLRAAPVVLSENALRASGGGARALLINAGNANAATGEAGRQAAERCAHAVTSTLGCAGEHVLVNSTGVIGVPLPFQKIVDAIPDLVGNLDRSHLIDAAFAIRTTDTTTKTACATIDGIEGPVTIVGIAKGSGMIHPDMATTIGVLLTDAKIDAAQLDAALHTAIDHSFHRISVDGDTSTNDAVYALASGEAGAVDAEAFEKALTDVAHALAMQIVRDGEGARKVITIHVHEAESDDAALAVARTVAQSLLVRTAVTGGDPNWGRIVAAACRAEVPVDPDAITLTADGVVLFRHGVPAAHDDATLAPVFQGPDVMIDLALGTPGEGDASFHTCDLTEDYIRINAEYTT